MITQSFSEFIRSRPAITAITTDIKPYVLDDDHDDPAITYSLRGERKISLLDNTYSDLSIADFDVLCWSDSYADAKDLANVVASEFREYSGSFGNEYEAQKIEAELGQDLLDPQADMRAATVIISVWNNPQ